jgi:hypothetical protein
MAATNSTTSPVFGIVRSRSAIAAIVGVVLVGCPTPAQEGGLLRVDNEGFARRLQMVCSSGHADPSCPSPSEASDASVVEDTGDAASEAASGE